MAMMDPRQMQNYMDEMMWRKEKEMEARLRGMQGYMTEPVPPPAPAKPSKPKHMNPLLLLSKGA